MSKPLKVSSSPHIRANHNVNSVMRDVIIALLPATAAAIYFFGMQALLVLLVTVISCVAFEALWIKWTKQNASVKDLSAIVTGILLAFNLPANVPMYVPVVGAFVAIILAKGVFGGIGQNFINPALAARAFLLSAYPNALRTFGPYNGGALDAVTGATPLELIKLGAFDGVTGATTSEVAQVALPSMMDVFVGNVNGVIGEVSALALLLGGGYLLVKKVITWHIPVFYIGSVFVVGLGSGMSLYESFYSLFLGGVILGAFFMATDYTTTPMTIKGQIIFAIGAGLITGFIRIGAGYPEGVSYSILLMNLAVPLIDRYVKILPFGRKAS